MAAEGGAACRESDPPSTDAVVVLDGIGRLVAVASLSRTRRGDDKEPGCRGGGAFLVPFRLLVAGWTIPDTMKAPCSCWSGGLHEWWAILGLNQ